MELPTQGIRHQLELNVELAEPLGTETLLYTQVNGVEVLGKMFNPRIVKPGEQLNFEVSLDKMHIFDAQSLKSVKIT